MGLYLDQSLQGETQLDWLEHHAVLRANPKDLVVFPDVLANGNAPVVFLNQHGHTVAGIAFSSAEFKKLLSGLEGLFYQTYIIPIQALDNVTDGCTSHAILEAKKLCPE